jgi:transcriptional regulator of aroF, aroG, tyrA and aromatic amino acid transport
MRLEISCQDRLGIAQDVLDILVNHEIDLRGIEIDQAGKIFLHFPNMDFEEFKHLMPKIRLIDGVEDVKTTAFMPGERERHQLSAILQTLPDPVFSIDTKGQVVTCNQAALATLEAEPSELKGVEAIELVKGFPITKWLEGNDVLPQSSKVKFIQQDYLADFLPVTVPDSANTSILAGAVIMLKSEVRLGQQFNAFHRRETDTFDQFVANSQAMRKVIREAKQVADLDAPIVVLGETGSGKEMMARACHQAGRRAEKPFLTLKCASLPDAIIDSELFGYEAGHLDQETGKAGLVEQAGQGTIFLDEVSNLSMDVQTKLLHLLETSEFSRIGGSTIQKSEARLVCTSTVDLGMLVEENKFSKELFYKLNVLSLGMPALRERKQDIVRLAEQSIAQHSAKLGKRPAKLSKSCVDFLQQYPWPGNVRQLQNALFRAISLLEGNEITKEDVQLPSCGPSVAYIDENFEGTLDEEVKKFERDLLRRLYPSYPSTRQLAKKLGLSHTAIANKLREYGINKGTVKL